MKPLPRHPLSPGAIERFRIDELLEELFRHHEGNPGALALESVTDRLADPDLAAVAAQAATEGLLRREADGRLEWTAAGESRARAVVRRHRLAEVLFTQVLELTDTVANSSACEMEHILSDAVADSVCAFLGHPPTCPHGRPIPPGSCCRAFSRTVEVLVMPLTELEPGARARVVFLSSRRPGRITRLGDLGVMPGAEVVLIQRKPAPVLRVGETELALEHDVASEIYVRRVAAS